MQHGKQSLGEMLVAANLIDEVQLQVALAEQRQSGKRFGSTLVELKFIDENVLAAFLSKQMDVPCISLLRIDIPKRVVRKLTRDVAVSCRAIPVRIDDDGRLEVAMVDPTDIDTLVRLETATGMTVSPLIAPESSIGSMVEKLYPEDVGDEQTLSTRQTSNRTAPNDPIFWDVLEELGTGDLDARLTRIEERIEQLWVLLEKMLRTLEARDGAPRER